METSAPVRASSGEEWTEMYSKLEMSSEPKPSTATNEPVLHQPLAIRSPRDGLRWERTLWDLIPRWTREPCVEAIEHVCRAKLGLPPEEPCTVTFHAAGILNKIYLISFAAATLIMRVSLPIYPGHKTRAEVTTLKWVRKHTKVPVPKVYSYDDTNHNEIGFEWILMEFMNGTSVRQRWRKMTMLQKSALVEQLAAFQAELSCIGTDTFVGIGSLTESRDSSDVTPGILVDHEFCMDDRINCDIPRGPFRTSHDWLSAVLNAKLQEQLQVLATSGDDADREDAENIADTARKLLLLLPQIFPASPDKPEATGIYHEDLNLGNILVDDNGRITAIIDWECVSALPTWMFDKVPKFLDDAIREDEPDRDKYGRETEEDVAMTAGRGDDPNVEDNEGIGSLYWEHRREWEATQLSKIYKDKMQELLPSEWLQAEDERTAEQDFYDAVGYCDHLISFRDANEWADEMLEGEIVRLADM